MLYQQLTSSPFIIAGPCVIESQNLLLEIAAELVRLQRIFNIPIIFKASFDKANRTAIHSFRGPGLKKGIEMLAVVKEKYQLPITTDIHESGQATPVAEVADILQIPAFLCRQTDLLLAASATNCIVNIKKAQFLSGKDMEHVINKVSSTGNRQILLTERGTMFGYNNLVVDYTGILDMMEYGYPVVMDATHSVQKPGGAGGKSGGNRAYAPLLAQAAAAIGIRGYFVETHPSPDTALSDGPNMLALDDLEKLLVNLQKIHQLKLS